MVDIPISCVGGRPILPSGSIVLCNRRSTFGLEEKLPKKKMTHAALFPPSGINCVGFRTSISTAIIFLSKLLTLGTRILAVGSDDSSAMIKIRFCWVGAPAPCVVSDASLFSCCSRVFFALSMLPNNPPELSIATTTSPSIPQEPRSTPLPSIAASAAATRFVASLEDLDSSKNDSVIASIFPIKAFDSLSARACDDLSIARLFTSISVFSSFRILLIWSNPS
mmetsp:Transcript_1576/g.2163  ORF Transcript_1576/g.2163 Transcript_1576/m.2163 type:complete len:223 (+) Transcript_1576:962-1630(+)